MSRPASRARACLAAAHSVLIPFGQSHYFVPRVRNFAPSPVESNSVESAAHNNTDTTAMVAAKMVSRRAGITAPVCLPALLLAMFGVLFHGPAIVVDAHSSFPAGCDPTTGHGNTALNGTEAGYTLTTTGTVAAGQKITVTLAAPSGGASDFMGFIVTADDGTVDVKDFTLSQSAAKWCKSFPTSVGHVSAAPKASVEVFVTLPSTAKTINVKAHIVKTRRTSYVVTLALVVPAAGATLTSAPPAPLPPTPPSSTCASSTLGYGCSTQIAEQVILHWTVGSDTTSPSLVGVHTSFLQLETAHSKPLELSMYLGGPWGFVSGLISTCSNVFVRS